jgi:hypothetical protein
MKKEIMINFLRYGVFSPPPPIVLSDTIKLFALSLLLLLLLLSFDIADEIKVQPTS